MLITKSVKRRPWSAYWATYDIVLSQNWAGKRILIPGCGTGEDAIRLATLGAEAYAFDLSPELLEITAARAKHHPNIRLHLDRMPAESLNYPAQFFDAVLFMDILHHVDIPRAMAEVRRVLKPGGLMIGNELYTHSILQRIRDSKAVRGPVYARMQKWIYGGVPYITEDEHKIDEAELAAVTKDIDDLRLKWFCALPGRLFPAGNTILDKVDRAGMALTMSLGRFLAGRVVFVGRVGTERD